MHRPGPEAGPVGDPGAIAAIAPVGAEARRVVDLRLVGSAR